MKPGLGALESTKDNRTIQHKDISLAGIPLLTGGADYSSLDIENQHTVGICTAIDRVQLREKQTGKKYSPEFQYLLQKKEYDKDWAEGSSLLNAMKVANNFGFLPAELWTYTTEADRSLPYAEYIAKLQAVSDADVTRLKALCVDKIIGYAFVDVTDSQAIARAITNSPGQCGIYCRYIVGNTWWSPSYSPKDINPLKVPTAEQGGHAITMCKFDYTTFTMQKLANTWGNLWCLQGSADINYSNYKPTEAWVDLLVNPMFQFTKNMKIGATVSPDVKELQKRLDVIQTGFFWLLTKSAVIKYQTDHGLTPDGEVGPLTRAALNKI